MQPSRESGSKPFKAVKINALNWGQKGTHNQTGLSVLGSFQYRVVYQMKDIILTLSRDIQTKTHYLELSKIKPDYIAQK